MYLLFLAFLKKHLISIYKNEAQPLKKIFLEALQMPNYPNHIMNKLMNSVEEMAQYPEYYVKNPDRDFTRNKVEEKQL